MRLSVARVLARSLCLFTLALLLPLVAGCGRSTGSVKGTVKVGSKMLKGGSITFVSTEGQPSQGTQIKEDGSYSIPSLTSGNYKVVVQTSQLKGMGGVGPQGGGGPKEMKAQKLDPGTAVPEGYTPSSAGNTGMGKNRALYVPIPDKYEKADTTDKTYNFPGGDQEFNIELDPK